MRILPGNVATFRRRAERARAVPAEGPEGWTKCPADPMKLLAVFPALAIRDGWTLRAYQFRAGGNGNAVVWAVPVGAPFPEPDECLPAGRGRLAPPKPPGALDDFREAIAGDEGPMSYLQASLFAREAAEFGALWHGCHWTDEVVLEEDPWASGPGGPSPELWPDEEESAWRWQGARPHEWAPEVERRGGVWTVRFHTFTPLEACRLLLYTDTYLPGGYRFTSECRTLAVGPGGIVY